MNVEPHLALGLLRAFARMEFALKCFPEFTLGEAGDTPGAQWTAFYVLARRHVEEHTFNEHRDVLLGTGPQDPPPMKMVLDANRRVAFVDAPLQGPVGDRLLDAARRVRNNLVHGGKEHPLQQRYPGHDTKLVTAATAVIHVAATAHEPIERIVFGRG